MSHPGVLCESKKRQSLAGIGMSQDDPDPVAPTAEEQGVAISQQPEDGGQAKKQRTQEVNPGSDPSPARAVSASGGGQVPAASRPAPGRALDQRPGAQFMAPLIQGIIEAGFSRDQAREVDVAGCNPG